MKCKTKIVVTSVSFLLLNVMQVAIGSTERAEGVIELTDANMDMMTAGGRSSANSYAFATGSATSTATFANTSATRRLNIGFSGAVAIACCRNSSELTNANASASGNQVVEYSGGQQGSGYSASWAAAYAY